MAASIDFARNNNDKGELQKHVEKDGLYTKTEVTENNSDEESSDDETRCGILGIKPNWLQVLASKKSYVLAYGVLGMNQSAIGSYFIGTISTIEKRFKIPSAKTGMIASAWDIGGLCSSMIMAYFGGTGHKTRWVAVGAIVAAISCFIRFIPHAAYGPGEPKSVSMLCNATLEEYCEFDNEGLNSFLILFFAHIMLGVGTCTYYTLGVAYLDDNSQKNKMPFLLALSTTLRGIGPFLGFKISALTLKRYIDPSADPEFDQDDPRWIGAWWYGWIPLGIFHFVMASIMSLFPKTLPREAKRRKSAGAHWSQHETHKSLKDFLKTMKRLVQNKILMFNSFSSTFYIFGMIAYWIYMPKYMETQFRITASTANVITGSVGVVCLGLGVMASGTVVSLFKPRPTYLAAWNVFTEAVDTIGHLAFAFIGCPAIVMHGSPIETTGLWNTTAQCNLQCNCPSNMPYTPVCDSTTNTTYFSPCHAGCLKDNGIDNSTKLKTYSNCFCLPDEGTSVVQGLCPVDCDHQFYIFLVLLILMKFLSSTGRAGNTVIQFRAVKPQDKAISIAMTEALLCVVTFIPAPIIYGYLQDYSCLLWNKNCNDDTGNCWLYDGKIMRYALNFTASSFLFLATLLDVGVLYNVKDLQIYDEDPNKTKSKTSSIVGDIVEPGKEDNFDDEEEGGKESLIIHNVHPID